MTSNHSNFVSLVVNQLMNMWTGGGCRTIWGGPSAGFLFRHVVTSSFMHARTTRICFIPPRFLKLNKDCYTFYAQILCLQYYRQIPAVMHADSTYLLPRLQQQFPSRMRTYAPASSYANKITEKSVTVLNRDWKRRFNLANKDFSLKQPWFSSSFHNIC